MTHILPNLYQGLRTPSVFSPSPNVTYLLEEYIDQIGDEFDQCETNENIIELIIKYYLDDENFSEIENNRVKIKDNIDTKKKEEIIWLFLIIREFSIVYVSALPYKEYLKAVEFIPEKNVQKRQAGKAYLESLLNNEDNKKEIENGKKRYLESANQYWKSEKGQATRKRLLNSEESQIAQKKYRDSEKGKAAQKRREEKYQKSEKGQATRKMYWESGEGRVTQKRYLDSKEGQAVREKYLKSEEGLAAKANSRFRQKKMDPEIKKMLTKGKSDVEILTVLKGLVELFRNKFNRDLPKSTDEYLRKRINTIKEKLAKEQTSHSQTSVSATGERASSTSTLFPQFV